MDSASQRPADNRPSRLGRAWLIVGLLFAAFFGIRAIPSRALPESTMGASRNVPAPQPRYITRNIEDLREGDTVIAADPETGEVAPRKILQKFERIAYKLCALELSTADGLTQTLEPTPEHPFYLPATNEWREAGDLHSGDRVLDPVGALQTVVTNRIDDHPEGVPVYNMEVEGLHTYFVSAHGARAPPVLVHNTNGSRCGTPSAKFVHDKFVQKVRPGAREKVFGTPWSKGKGYGSRKFDDFDSRTGTAFEGNTTPWRQMTEGQFARKMDQAAADFAILRTNQRVKRIVWFGTEELPTSGLGGQLREALSKSGIEYWVVVP